MALFGKKGKDNGPSAGSKLKVSLANNDTEYTFTVEGRLDTLTSPELEGQINAIIGDASKIYLDLAKLEYISSAGLRVLLGTAQGMDGKGGMILKNVTPDVREIFDLTGFIQVFTIE